MIKKILHAIIFLCVPAAILVTAIIKREPIYQGKPAAIWVREIRTNRDVALKALQHLGRSALPALQEMLNGNSPTESCRAAWAMGRLNPAVARAAVPDLIQRVDDGNVVLQEEAMHSLSLIGITNETIVPKLVIRLSKDYNANFVAELLLSIEQSRMAAHLPPIPGDEFDYDLAFAKSSSTGVRMCGAYKLSMLAKTNDPARTALKSLLNDPDAGVRAETSRLIANPAPLPSNFRLVGE